MILFMGCFEYKNSKMLQLAASRLVPFIFTGTKATGYSSGSYLPGTAGYIRGSSRIPAGANIVSVVCG